MIIHKKGGIRSELPFLLRFSFSRLPPQILAGGGFCRSSVRRRRRPLPLPDASLSLPLSLPLSEPLLFLLAAAVFGVAFPALMASSKSRVPTRSARASTRVLTVAPSRRFLPSRRLAAILSVKAHSLPSGRSSPVAGSRGVRHSGSSWSRGWLALGSSLERTTRTMPSSWKRW